MFEPCCIYLLLQGAAGTGSQTPYVILHRELSSWKKIWDLKTARVDAVNNRFVKKTLPFTLGNDVCKEDMPLMDIG